MASKTYIYRDLVSGCEMFSVAHPHHLMPGNDAVVCVQSAMINENGDAIDVGGGGNHFGGEDAMDRMLERIMAENKCLPESLERRKEYQSEENEEIS